MSGPDLVVKPDAAHYVGLALHELATNASKYGALTKPEGKVEVRWRLAPEEGGAVEISWQELGGPPVEPPKANGFGRMLIKKLAATALDGRADLEFAPGGVKWRLRFPVSHVFQKHRS